MKKRFSEEQIIGFLKEAEAGMPVKELCRKHGFSDASFYTWRAKFGGMEVSDAKRLKDLESENAKLKKLLAEAMLDMEALKVVVKGKHWRSFASITTIARQAKIKRLPRCALVWHAAQYHQSRYCILCNKTRTCCTLHKVKVPARKTSPCSKH
jgi:putative transposase